MAGALLGGWTETPLFAGAPLASESERLDRIVSVRSRELRDNRFARWGVPR